ncbi:putative GTP binding protein 7 isoform 2 family protein [Cardiosporidium cionae]|uniref:GTP binding protein 7 isoform 2 family protein n=1 Tax=Cardiosporidium cionae TaxID=476202 RepID=A0ABQ7JB69_9APIC|nr:putative GTP binding protein 7 isoform 2 family protein [Cardiosporidium cionae]|eukprot:KAF8821248.1 putative GTP binding protein 7 isoform 2 family protein [Cardiosporidium cionae]
MTSSHKKGGLWWRSSGPMLSDRWIGETLSAKSTQINTPLVSSAKDSKQLLLENAKNQLDASIFHPREHFQYDPHVTYCPSYTSRDAQRLMEKLKAIDVVFEVRDARAPLTSSNYFLTDKISSRIKRVVILNKMDLVPPKFLTDAKSLIESSNIPCITTCATDSRKSIKIKQILLDEIVPKFKEVGVWMMFLGLPNTGKSSLINSLKRLSFAASKHGHLGNKSTLGLNPRPLNCSSMPGSTKRIDHFLVSKSPRFYCVDTPGIMMPKVERPETNLKLGALGCAMDWKMGEMYIADWILFFLNKNHIFSYTTVLGLSSPSNDIKYVGVHSFVFSRVRLWAISIVLVVPFEQVSSIISQTLNGSNTLASIDCLSGCRYFLQLFRAGAFGKIYLDDLPSIENITSRCDRTFDELEPPGPWGPAAWPTPLTGL